jgi:hypothetical protein
MERQSKGSRVLEAYCKGGQGPPRAVAPPEKEEENKKNKFANKRKYLSVSLQIKQPTRCTLSCKIFYCLNAG